MSKLSVLLVFSLALIPTAAHAQSAIAGAVTDATRSVLPGVTVEARSPALIEQARSVVTDGQGQYRVVDLPPGTYSVTFSLPGFTTILREQITIQSNFTATVDAEMRIGAVSETITVSGASPVVDVQTTTRREVMTSEMVQMLPTGRHLTMIGATMPSVNQTGVKDVGGLTTMQQTPVPLAAYGSRDMALEIDGLPITFPRGTGLPGVYHDVGAFQEFVYQVSGATAEGQTGGVRLNMISKTGSNTFAGVASAMWSGPSVYSNNIGPELVARGIVSPPGLVRLMDLNADLGGPLRKDRVWFYFSVRDWGVDTKVSMLHDGRLEPAGTPVVDANTLQSYLLRLTLQVNARNKVTAMYNRQPRWRRFFGGVETLTVRPEATNIYETPNNFLSTAKWTSTITNKLLVEAGFAPIHSTVQGVAQPGTKTPAENPPYGDIRHCDLVLNLCSNAAASTYDSETGRQSAIVSVAYVTGAHSLKAGYQGSRGYLIDTTVSSANGAQLYRTGVPFAFDAYNTPIDHGKVLAHEHGLYVQDTWTFKRLTLNPGVRWDRFIGSVPAQSFPAGRFVPARTFAAIENLPNWTNVAPRFGASYDLFGQGRTALKGTVGKYVLQQSTGATAPFNPSQPGTLNNPTSDRRDWTDLNGDDVAQDNELGPSRNATFARANRNPDPNLHREYDLVYNVSLDHELTRGFGVSLSYTRRETRNTSWIDNVNQAPADYELLTVADPRGNGMTLPVYQIIPSKLAPVVELIRNSGDGTRTFAGIDALFHARVGNGTTLSGGVSSGRLVRRLCSTENLNGLRFCDESKFDIPFRTTVKFAGSYLLPWYGFSVSGTFQSLLGDERVWVYNVTRTQLPQLQTVSSVNVRLTEPGSQYFERINEVDLSLSGRVHTGKRVRVKPQIDLFNLFNVNPILTEVGSFPIQDRPRLVLAGRVLRLGVQVTY